MIPMRVVNPAAEQSSRYEINSPLLFGALQPLLHESRLTLLDLVPANADLLDYFSQYHCKLYLPDCQQELLNLSSIAEESLPVEDIIRYLSLSSCQAEELDVILLWDLPNYLDRSILSALVQHLLPYVSQRTVIHTYIHNRQHMPEHPADFRLTPEHTVSVTMTGDWNLASPMYYQELLNKTFAPFHIDRGMLLGNGLQEYILRKKSA